MKKHIRIQILHFLMFGFAILCLFTLYQSWCTQQDYKTTNSVKASEYNYEEVQEMVSTPSSSSDPASNLPEETVPLYNTQEMLAINPNFTGWLQIPNTSVHYPVVQTTDNNTYLTRSFSGEYSSFGSLFLDQNSAQGSRNRVIHGHNMGNGRTEMFSELINYQDPDWAGERQFAFFTEPDDMDNNRYKLFAVLNFNVNDLDTFNYFQTEFETEDDFQSFLTYLIEHSLYDTEYRPEQETLILSTCNRAYGADNRLLICYGRTSSTNS